VARAAWYRPRLILVRIRLATVLVVALGLAVSVAPASAFSGPSGRGSAARAEYPVGVAAKTPGSPTGPSSATSPTSATSPSSGRLPTVARGTPSGGGVGGETASAGKGVTGLPFTGLLLIPVLGAGMLLLLSGGALRRVARRTAS
jgi:hypothetical protein